MKLSFIFTLKNKKIIKNLKFSESRYVNIYKTISVKTIKKDFEAVIDFKKDELIYENEKFNYMMRISNNYNTVYLDIETKNGDDSIDLAKIISKLSYSIYSGEHRKDYHITKSNDGASDYFCSTLIPKISKFERLLREFIYLMLTFSYDKDWVTETLSKELENKVKKNYNQDNKGRQKNDIENLLESFDFNDYITYLFEEKESEKNIDNIESIKKALPNHIKKDNVKTIKIVEKSLWDKMFYSYNIYFDKEKFENIRKIRNKVMHNKEINYNEFLEYDKLLDETIENIEAIILDIKDGQYYDNISPEDFEELVLRTRKLFISMINRPFNSIVGCVKNPFNSLIKEVDREINSLRINVGINNIEKPIIGSQIILANQLSVTNRVINIIENNPINKLERYLQKQDAMINRIFKISNIIDT